MNYNLSLENWHSGYKDVNVDEAYDNFLDVSMKYMDILSHSQSDT